jgi:hypothetical protein
MAAPSVRYVPGSSRFAFTLDAGPPVYLDRQELLRLQAEARDALRDHAEDVIRSAPERSTRNSAHARTRRSGTRHRLSAS